MLDVDAMYYVKEQGIGVEGMLLLDSEEAVDEMIQHCDIRLVNIIVSKGNEEREMD